jgi:acyl-CoA thioesterase
MSFAELIARAEPRGHGLALTAPDSWMQGRTVYGGFSAALALAAAVKVGGEGLPPLRSAVVSFVGPAYGALEARARVLRRGKNATWIDAELTREGEVTATATFVFMGPVESALHLNDCPPPAGFNPPEAGTTFEPHPFMPVFLRENFDVRFAVPKSDAKLPDLCWWARLKDRGGIDPMGEVLLIGDALPPGVLPLLGARAPVSSMTWQINLLTSSPVTRDGWFLLRSRGDYAEAGCSSQTMTIWNADGAPVASGMQSIAVFG